MSSPFYESDAALAQYLLFHYGTPEQICPLLPAMRDACGFPARAVEESLRRMKLGEHRRALDLGCAVGRGSLELGRHFDEVLGIDFSQRFIAAASRLRDERSAEISVPREGDAQDKFHITIPAGLRTGHVRFEQGDASHLRSGLGRFDLILMANLIDRLPDPARCLGALPELVRPGGWLVITSPYTWMEEYTPRAKWLDGAGLGTQAGLERQLTPVFTRRETFDLPFLIREHRRKYQWSIAEVSLWQRQEDASA